ncbi:uncharacterized protein LOC123536350 isoform X2 [Mercenaria mercenaria]|uniref:uncharacterized protein LOC123536350 isoform X2 n=1 Tax=Mercenaria mercenaria TaxID=6596 RepID=UPI00234F3E71|nr:uncharacterized protein LOC123536350 isoform X2 [Mercenaria mercenaria]
MHVMGALVLVQQDVRNASLDFKMSVESARPVLTKPLASTAVGRVAAYLTVTLELETDQFSCAEGWSGPPKCQTPCSNATFGSNCNYQCHCPPEDSCSPIIGLCSSNQCAVGWSSAGCQNELPQLTNPPTEENVTCSNATVVWQGWQRNTDRGNPDRPIAQYELYMSYNASREAEPEWRHVRNVQHNANVNEYRVFLAVREPDVFYVFRVDVRQQDGDKLMRYVLDGKVSKEIFIPCTMTGSIGMMTTVGMTTTTVMMTSTTVATTVDPIHAIVQNVFCQNAACISCANDLQILCGSDGQLYPNQCTLAKQRCVDPTLTVADMSTCPKPGR